MTSPTVPSRECANCPSFSHSAEKIDFDGKKSYVKNFDHCTRHGHVLSGALVKLGTNSETVMAVNVQIRTNRASACDSFGNERVVHPNPPLQIGMGDPAAFAAGNRGAGDIAPATCNGCEFFVGPNAVFNEFGWNAGMCAAKGRLIFLQRSAEEAKNCAIGRAGAVRQNAEGILVDASLTGIVPPAPTATKASTFNLDKVLDAVRIDPRDYPTDKPVSPKMAALGIRAFRAIEDPEGEKPPVMLPIFNGEQLCGFDPRETYEDGTELYIDTQGVKYDLASEWITQESSPVLIGEAGTGKTMLGFHMAYLMDLPATLHQIEPQTDSYVFFGEPSLVQNDNGVQVTSFREGEFTRDFYRPGVSIIDELNTNDECAMAIRSVLGGSRWIRVEAAGYKVERHIARFLVSNQNPADNPIYTGTKPLSAAELSRLSPIYIGLPDEATERMIIKEHCARKGYDIDPLIIDKLMQVAVELRAMIADGVLPISWGIRDQVKVALKTRSYSFEKSYRRAIIDALEANVVDSVINVVRTVG